MKTIREINSFESLILMIHCEWDFIPLEIKISPYFYDHRIKWDTHIVSAKFQGLEDSGFMPVGFLNRAPNWDPKKEEGSENDS